MRIPPEQLIEGVSRTLLEQVLPHVSGRAARGQLYAAVDVLRNLAQRVEAARAPFEAEADSAEAALRAVVAPLRSGGAAALADRIEAALAAGPAAPPPARAEAARAALRLAFAGLEGIPPALAASVRVALGGHLAAQAVRGLAGLQPSLLEEISRG